MKKIGCVLIFAVVMFGCSACSVNFNIDTNGSDTKAETTESVAVSTEAPEQNFKEENANVVEVKEEISEDFYGVWCSGSKSESDAEDIVLELENKGFEAQVFVTTDWENLNTEKYYVVTAGVCETKQEAEQLLSRVKNSGYPDAYVKYSGERK